MSEPATGGARGAPMQSGTNGKAIASLVLAIIGGGIGSILAIIFGRQARREIDASGGAQGGRGLATAGIILGWIGIVAIAIVILIAVIASASS